MADEKPPKEPRRLEMVRREPALSPIPEIMRPLKRWWRQQHLDDMPEATTLPTAMRDVGILALGHIAKRLADPKTPMKVKDQMAMVMGPKLGVQLRGQRDELQTGPSPGHGVLDAYRKK